MRVITIRHRAWLASRLPPGLSRRRVTFPDEAGIGATAHRCAHVHRRMVRQALAESAGPHRQQRAREAGSARHPIAVDLKRNGGLPG